MKIASFAGLAAFVCGTWAGMVADPPVLGMSAVVALATGLGVALIGLRSLGLPRPATWAAALVLTLVAGAAALAVAGLPLRLMPPGRWDELGAALDQGLSGIRTAEWPYAGAETWVRLVILLATPAVLTIAAAVTFWPADRGRPVLRALGLICLLALYGVGVTENDPGEPLVRGLALFGVVAVWLWAPRLKANEATAAAVTVLTVGVMALPVAARLDGQTAVIDYQAWNWFGSKSVTFNWNHSYGPLDWSRNGTTLLQVKSDRPLYWKAEVLDSFDGLRWVRSPINESTPFDAELPAERPSRWQRSFRVTVRSLSTNFLIGAGTPTSVSGVPGRISGSADGTISKLDEPLERGDSYEVRAYVPTPKPGEMRRAPATYSGDLSQYTRVLIPLRGENALRIGRDDGSPAASSVSVPPWGASDPEAAATLRRSPYAGTYRLTRRLTSGASTPYDAVRAIERYLRRGFTYSERPPNNEYPLETFLLKDKIGYCQYFSGGMALMLRMSGIPARVASGFAPGSRNRDTGEFRVRDLDAHSWVEAYFTGIGWVTFDPTPAASPADRGERSSSFPLGDRPQPGAANTRGNESPNRGNAPGLPASGARGGSPDGGSALPVLGALAAIALGAGALFVLRRRSEPDAAAVAEAGILELQRALPALGWPLPAGATLLELEGRLRRTAGPGSAEYVARLRQDRFAATGAPAPGRAARKALRRELTRSGGPLARLRGLRAIPPRGPAI